MMKAGANEVYRFRVEGKTLNGSQRISKPSSYRRCPFGKPSCILNEKEARQCGLHSRLSHSFRSAPYWWLLTPLFYLRWRSVSLGLGDDLE